MQLPRLYLLFACMFFLPVSYGWGQDNASDPDTQGEQIAAVQSTMDQAIARVKEIVNQPVTHVPRRGWMQVSMFQPGWFHAGAAKPDFNTVDVRLTQQMPYEKYKYVSSDLNPGEAFVGSELEFNPMTKYFYTDRSVPKKKLSDADMVEINRLYRVIGQCTQQLAELNAGKGLSLARVGDFLNSPAGTIVLLVLVIGVGTLLYRRWYVKP